MNGKNNKNVRARTIVISILAIISVFVLAMGVVIYGFGIRNSFFNAAAKIIPYPASIVGGTKIVSIESLNENLASVEKFYKNQDFSEIGFRVDFDTQDGQKRLKIKEKEVLNKLIENEAIEKLASERGIRITKEMAMQNVSGEMSRYGNEDYVKNNLLNLYGWSIDDFVEKLVKPDLYREELEKKIRETEVNFVQANDKIKKAQAELASGKDFAETAKKYSEAESAKNGGDLGWFAADQIIPEVAVSVFPLKKGERSDIVESPLGFHIVQIEDRKTEDGAEKIKVRQILAKTKTFADWLAEEEKKMNIHILLKEYYWDKDKSRLEFKNKDMQDFENNLEKNSAGDISVLF